jgi:SAM-dependent methyltransferase
VEIVLSEFEEFRKSMNLPIANLDAYRNSEKEQKRIASLFTLIPAKGNTVLDIGARDGYLSILLADRFSSVTALDLEKPVLQDPRITCIRGDMTAMDFPDRHFDVSLCAEVLEHIPSNLLVKACKEISRVTKDRVVIGVPFEQDIRQGRTTCANCGGKSPPWGHVNSFTLAKLSALFPGLEIEKVDYVGSGKNQTNFLSTWLMDFAGNPYGTYGQEEGCVHCGAKLMEKSAMTLSEKMATVLGHRLQLLQERISNPKALWINVLFRKS